MVLAVVLLTIGWSPLYQELTRVPLVVRAPGVVPGRRAALTTASDIPATILDLVGIEPAVDMHGKSLKDVLLGETNRAPAFRRQLVAPLLRRGRADECNRLASAADRELHADHGDDSPLVVRHRRARRAPELYDLERDPAESVNVWAENAAEGSQLFQQAIEFLEECGTSERFLAPRREALLRSPCTSPRQVDQPFNPGPVGLKSPIAPWQTLGLPAGL